MSKLSQTSQVHSIGQIEFIEIGIKFYIGSSAVESEVEIRLDK